MTAESGTTSPLSSTRVGTVPAGFSSRYSGRRSQTFSSRSSNGRRFSARTRRTLRAYGDSVRWYKTRIGKCYRTPFRVAQSAEWGICKENTASDTFCNRSELPAPENAPPGRSFQYQLPVDVNVLEVARHVVDAV